MNNDRIEFSYGGYFEGYKTLRYSDGTVAWSLSINPYDEHTKNVSEEKLEAFWRQIEDIGVWDWQDQYVDPGIRDGIQWSLELVYGERVKMISGSNMFPPNISISDERKSEAFHQLCQAVNMLIGIKYF